MTTQAVEVALVASDGSTVRYTLTATDDQWNTLTDETSSLQAYQMQKGKRILAHNSGYSGGAMAVRLRNVNTGRIIAIGVGQLLTEMEPQGILQGAFVMLDNDVIEAFPVAVPT